MRFAKFILRLRDWWHGAVNGPIGSEQVQRYFRAPRRVQHAVRQKLLGQLPKRLHAAKRIAFEQPESST